MNKVYWNSKFKKIFGLPKDAVILFYRHPKEFKRLEYEKINPDHIGLIWGYRNKKYTKNKHCNPVQIGKVLLPSIILYINLNWFFTFYFCLVLKIFDLTFISFFIYTLYALMFIYSIKFVNKKSVVNG